MTRGLSTLEILIALSFMTAMIVATAQVVEKIPDMLTDTQLEREAYSRASLLLREAELTNARYPGTVRAKAPAFNSPYLESREVETVYEDLASRITARVEWTTSRGKQAEISERTVVFNIASAADIPCLPIPIGAWDLPTHTSYAIADMLPPPWERALHPPSSLAALKDTLAIGIESAQSVTEPTLLFFSLGKGGSPTYLSGFDAAPASRTGIVALAVGGGHIYAGNGFGSASTATCGQFPACAQVIIFSVSGNEAPVWVGAVQLATASPPFARTVSESSAGATSIAYRRGYLYVGLEKTAGGSEFNIIDVGDPSHPLWVAGVPIGRSVTSLAITGARAYLATSDARREFVIIDIANPKEPKLIGSWDAPGTSNFGIGSTLVVHGTRAYFGRTYVGNAPEFYVLDVTDAGRVVPLVKEDIATPLRPESIRGVVVRDYLASILSGKRLMLWDASAPGKLSRHAAEVALRGTGTTLFCRGNSLLIGSVGDDGQGLLEVVTSP